MQSIAKISIWIKRNTLLGKVGWVSINLKGTFDPDNSGAIGLNLGWLRFSAG
jgi:hypothetical protein